MARYQIFTTVSLIGMLDVFATNDILSIELLPGGATRIVVGNTDDTVTSIIGNGLAVSGGVATAGTMTSITRTSADGSVTYELIDQLFTANNSFATFWNFADQSARFAYIYGQSDSGHGSAGDDVISLGAGQDNLYGYAGSDLLIGGTSPYDGVYYSSDAAFGGTNGVVVNISDVDVIDPDNAISIAAGTALDGFHSTDVLFQIENVIGTGQGDYIIGNAMDNAIASFAGNDVLIGGDGYDFITPGAGADVINGLPQEHADQSEDDKDTVYYSDGANSGIGVIVNLSATAIDATIAAGTFNVSAYSARDWSGATDQLIDIERVQGTNAADYLRGSDTGNFRQERFSGLGGDDYINGGAGWNQVDYHSDASYGGFASVLVNLATGIATDGFGGHDTLIGIDSVLGTAGSDVMIGNADRNQFRSYGGSDYMDGGAGIDYVDMYLSDNFIGTGAVVDLSLGTAVGVFGGTSTLVSIEDVWGSYRDDIITGSSISNYLSGDIGNDTIIGGAGDDIIEGGPGNNTLDGGDGIDTLSYLYDPVSAQYYHVEFGALAQSPFTDHGVIVSLAAHSATNFQGGLDTINNFENVVGTFFDDALTGDAGDNVFSGLTGNDYIDGFGGSDTVSYARFDYDGRVEYFIDGMNGSNPDGVTVNLATGTASDGNGGADTLVSIENVVGSRGADTIIGSDEQNVIEGGAAGDALDGGAGDRDTASYEHSSAGVTVTINGGGSGGDAAGDTLVNFENLRGSSSGDLFAGDGSDNILEGRGGNDTMFGGAGHDTLSGEDGDDTLVGNEDVFAQELDTLSGGNGDDTIVGERTDHIDGGAGIDVLYASNAFDWSIDLGSTSIETFISGFGNDTIDASAQAVGVTIFASGGNDIVTGSGFGDFLWAGFGDDTVDGGEGADVVVGDVGADHLSGGGGDDQVYTDGADVALDGGSGTDALYIAGGTGITLDLAGSAFEWVVDSAGGNDTLDGSAMSANVVVFAGAGTDMITGGSGADFLWGEAGDDTIVGGTNGDVLVGGAGGDTIVGGAGIDTLFMGSGGGADGSVDTAVYNAASWGIDFVYNFEHGIDQFDMRGSGATLGALSISDVGGQAYVSFGGSDLIVVVGLGGTLTAADFAF